MATVVVNSPNPGTIKLPRGRPVNLGTLAAAVGSVVQFTIPEPTYFNQGGLVLQISNGQTGGTYQLEASLDGAASWFAVTTVAAPALTLTDTAASAAFTVNVNGFGSGALFRFGIASGTITGTAAVWALVG